MLLFLTQILFLGLLFLSFICKLYLLARFLNTLFLFFGLFGKYFSARFTLQCIDYLEQKTVSLPCMGVFSLTSQDEEEDDGCGVCRADSESLLWFSTFFSFPIFSYSDSALFKVFFIFFRTKTYFLYSFFPFSVFLSFSLFLWWYLSQYFLFEALLFLTDLGLPILLQRK